MVRGLSPLKGEIFCTRPDRLWGSPNLLHNGYRLSLSGVKWPEHGFKLPSPSSAKVTERVELYICSFCGSSWSVLGWKLPFIFYRWRGIFFLVLRNKTESTSSTVFLCVHKFVLMLLNNRESTSRAVYLRVHKAGWRRTDRWCFLCSLLTFNFPFLYLPG